MIVLLLSCSKSWSQNEYTASLTGDSVMVAISDIKLANIKLIKAKYNEERLIVKDSIITLQVQRFDALMIETTNLQDKLKRANTINKSLNRDVEKLNKRNKILSGVSCGAIAAFLVSIFLK